MPRYKKPGSGRDFKPGISGNPSGRPPMPQDVNDARRMSKIEFIRLCNEYLYMTRQEITTRLNAPETPAIELIVGSIVTKSATEGDQSRLSFLLDRMIGKVKERVEHTGADDGPIKIDETISEEELNHRASKIFQRLKDKFKNEP